MKKSKKIVSIIVSVLSVVLAFGIIRSVVVPKSTTHTLQTGGNEQQEPSIATNKYHVGAVLTFNNSSAPVLTSDSLLIANIEFKSTNVPNVSKFSCLNVFGSGGTVTKITALSSEALEYTLYDLGWTDEWGMVMGQPDVWTLTADIPENEDYAVLRAWLDANVTV